MHWQSSYMFLGPCLKCLCLWDRRTCGGGAAASAAAVVASGVGIGAGAGASAGGGGAGGSGWWRRRLRWPCGGDRLW